MQSNDTKGREQRTTFLLDAPIDLVWEVWTKPDHIKHWWGPNGFTNTIDKMDVVNGGEWLFTMHGPDGMDYPNKTIFREVVFHNRLVHEHLAPNFIAVISFESLDGKTFLNWYKLYETKELYELVEVQYKTNEGLMQTIEKLKNYLSQFSK